jgi:hypothetical protein
MTNDVGFIISNDVCFETGVFEVIYMTNG